ncbi:hypothetical protein GDO81_029195 [Engystomops pustulosus]|uniref:Uncharacterized protein n=1 Tax=Engystomops pustulosus TaxID=76066 RepID=A0AAV6YWE1_ENGPU|nr:hypothetical protein GDO81_029194 [Engystomops pustulosus]KAG8541357.1 hypothetical protein GDO81_029195 [Engystomops pustulosus]
MYTQITETHTDKVRPPETGPDAPPPMTTGSAVRTAPPIVIKGRAQLKPEKLCETNLQIAQNKSILNKA